MGHDSLRAAQLPGGLHQRRILQGLDRPARRYVVMMSINIRIRSVSNVDISVDCFAKHKKVNVAISSKLFQPRNCQGNLVYCT